MHVAYTCEESSSDNIHETAAPNNINMDESQNEVASNESWYTDSLQSNIICVIFWIYWLEIVDR
jgi:hypothetical protein